MARGARQITGGVLALMLLVASAGDALGQEGGSPAGGHAQVIAHGVIPMPTDELTWRLYEGVARGPGEAEPLVTDWSGFVLGRDDPALVDDDGERSVVSEGKATLVREGSSLTVSGLDGGEANYDWLVLTAAELNEDDSLVLSGDPFDAPGDGEYRVDLVRDVLAEGEETDIAAGVAPTALLVLEGEASVAVDGPGGDSARVREGDGYTADGLLTVRAREDDTVILAAVIGDEVATGGISRPRPTPAGAATGAIEFATRTCAPGIGVEEISFDVCVAEPPVAGEGQLLTFDGTEQIAARDFGEAVPGQSGYLWDGLELRTHVLQVFASGGENVYVEETEQVAFIPGPQWEITLTEAAPYALVVIYRLTEEIPAEEVSTVTVTFLGCEAGQDPAFFLPENCYDAIEGSAAISSDALGLDLGPDDAVVNEDGSLTWTLLGYGDAAVAVLDYPAAYVDYAVSAEVVVTEAEAPDAYVYVYCFLPLGE